jgi:hypothetical protein
MAAAVSAFEGLGRRAWAAVPRVKGTQCRLCRYEVPALGLPPDSELAWFERFEGKPCPNCCGLALGLALGAVLVGALRRSTR